MSEITAYLRAIEDDKLELVIEDNETAEGVFPLDIVYSRSYIKSVLSAIPNVRKTNDYEYVYSISNFNKEIFDQNLLREVKNKAQNERLKHVDKSKTFYTLVYINKNSFEWKYCVTEHEFDVKLIGRQSSRSFILLNNSIWGELYDILSFINNTSIGKLTLLKDQ